MIKIMILRVVWALATAALAGCGRAALASNDGAAADTSMGGTDALVRGDTVPSVNGDGAMGGGDAGIEAATDAAQPSPLDLPGIVVWLDADVGIEGAGSDRMTWTDRSAYRHVFMAQSAEAEMPALSRLNGHRAVRFNGRNRFISEQAPSVAQQDALSLGRDFIIAMVLLPEQAVTRDSILAIAALPWIGSPPVVLGPLSAPTFLIKFQADPALSFQADAAGLRLGGDFVLSSQRLIMSTVDGKQIRVRLNGQLQAGTPQQVSDPSDGAYAPIYLGSWDFDTFGYQGIVAEMIVVRGPADEATEKALDDYFKMKFSI